MLISKKKMVLGVVAAMTLVSAGCTSGSNDSGKAASGSDSHLNQVLKAKEIKVAVQSEAAPWGVLQSNGQYEGFDIDIAKALAKSLGAKVKFISTTNESRIPLLQADKADVVIAAFTATNERAQSVEFSIPFAAGGTLIAVPANGPITSYADLDGKTVSASRGSIGEAVLTSKFPKTKPALFNSFADSVQALKSRKVDALIENNVIVPDLATKDKSIKVLAGPVLNPALMSIGVKRGDQAWLNYIDTFVRNYNVNGENEAATQKWLHQPMPEYLK